MAWQPPDNFDNNLDDYDLNAIASQTSGDTGLGGTDLVTMQWLTEDDPTMSFANGQYPTFGNEHLALDNWAPLPHPTHQVEMAGSLNGVGGLFDSQPPGDTAYASVDAFAVAAEGGRDAPAHALTDANATVDGQPTSQRRPRARPPSPQEWEQHKTAIHSFYMEQELTLRTTMQLMQRHHQFQATEKMYKDKFKQWNWSKNLPRAMAGRMLDVGNQRWPKRTYFLRNDRKWTMEEIQKRHSRRSAQGDSSLQEDSSIPDDFTYGTPPSSGITDTESVLENSRGTDGDLEMADAATADTTKDLRKFLAEGRCRTNSTPEELYSRARDAVKAAEAGICNHEEAESPLRDAFSYFRHHFSPTHSKTVEIGYFLVSFYVKIERVNDAHCILDWMTKEHCGDAKSYNDGTVTYVLSTIAILRRTGRDKEANLLTIRLLEYRQTSKADHFLLRNCSSPSVGSNEMIENLLTSSEHEKLEAMPKILERLSTDSNNHMFLQDLLPRYIQKCDQLTLEKQAIHSRCIFAAVLAKNASFGKAIDTLKEAERLLDMFLKKSIGSQRPLELSTLKLARRLAFTFGDSNDPDACVRVLNTLLKHMHLDKDNDVHNGYGPLVCNFLKSTASQLHKKGFCEQSRAWINQAFITSQDLFGDNHECTKRIHEVMLTCEWETFFL